MYEPMGKSRGKWRLANVVLRIKDASRQALTRKDDTY
jgi:hypothetical protein